MNFAVPADLRVKLKESKKRVKYLDLARELKKTKEYESEGDCFSQFGALLLDVPNLKINK